MNISSMSLRVAACAVLCLMALAASAAAMPLRQAPWAVEKSCTEHASPAKNSFVATGAARTLRASACPGSAWE